MERIRTLGYLTRREREIMDALYKLGKATGADVLDRLPENAATQRYAPNFECWKNNSKCVTRSKT